MSKKIRASARGEDCSLRMSQSCQDGETVVLCHLNSNSKGMRQKSPDAISCYGCYWCHQDLDAGLISDTHILRAWKETIIKLIQKGLLIES